jgi:hypothetical protein
VVADAVVGRVYLPVDERGELAEVGGNEVVVEHGSASGGSQQLRWAPTRGTQVRPAVVMEPRGHQPTTPLVRSL